MRSVEAGTAARPGGEDGSWGPNPWWLVAFTALGLVLSPPGWYLAWWFTRLPLLPVMYASLVVGPIAGIGILVAGVWCHKRGAKSPAAVTFLLLVVGGLEWFAGIVLALMFAYAGAIGTW